MKRFGAKVTELRALCSSRTSSVYKSITCGTVKHIAIPFRRTLLKGCSYEHKRWTEKNFAASHMLARMDGRDDEASFIRMCNSPELSKSPRVSAG